MSLRFATILIALASPVSADVPRVVTDILPVHSLVARVMQGVGEPDLILPPGASPHGHAMRPSEAAALEQADIVFWIGPGLTPWLANPVETLAGDADVVALLDQAGTTLIEAEDEDGHDHGDIDPHAWLDPENADAAQTEISTLIEQMGSALAPLMSVEFAVYHDAYGYLERRFGIEPRFALLSSDADKPTPRRIADLQRRVRDERIGVIFTEPMAGARLVATVFDGTEVARCEIDVVGAGTPPGPNHYWQSLLEMAETMGRCGAVGTGVD